MATNSAEQYWDEYIAWLATPPNERGEVSTEEEWANAHGYADSRTTRRWKNNPKFQERQKRLAESMASKSGATITFDSDSKLEPEERDYVLVKSKLVESAKNGNLKAQELYLKSYGKTWIDEEQAARSADFSNLELSDLITIAIMSLDEDALIGALRSKGYTVSKGE